MLLLICVIFVYIQRCSVLCMFLLVYQWIDTPDGCIVGHAHFPVVAWPYIKHSDIDCCVISFRLFMTQYN